MKPANSVCIEMEDRKKEYRKPNMNIEGETGTFDNIQQQGILTV